MLCLTLLSSLSTSLVKWSSTSSSSSSSCSFGVSVAVSARQTLVQTCRTLGWIQLLHVRHRLPSPSQTPLAPVGLENFQRSLERLQGSPPGTPEEHICKQKVRGKGSSTVFPGHFDILLFFYMSLTIFGNCFLHFCDIVGFSTSFEGELKY